MHEEHASHLKALTDLILKIHRRLGLKYSPKLIAAGRPQNSSVWCLFYTFCVHIKKSSHQ